MPLIQKRKKLQTLRVFDGFLQFLTVFDYPSKTGNNCIL
jgi:hypothetical protein